MITDDGRLLLKYPEKDPEFAIYFENLDVELSIDLDNKCSITGITKHAYCVLSHGQIKELKEFLIPLFEFNLFYDSDGKDLNPEFRAWYQKRKEEVGL